MKKQPTQEQANSALECILGQKTVGFYPVIAKALGSAPAAIMVSQAFFWQYKAKFGSPIVIDGEQYFSKTVAEWYEETSVSESAQRLARSILVKHGIMIEKLAGLPASMHFRVDINALVAVINGYLSTGITVAAKHGNKERELTRTGSGKFRRQEATKDGDILNVETSESFESEGERTPPAPNPSNLKEEKKESGLVAPDLVESAIKEYLSERLESLLPDPEIPPSPNSAPPPSPLNLGFCGNCMGLGYRNGRNGRETCEVCDGSGHGDQMIDAKQFEVTAIASPTDLPGVTIVEAAQKFPAASPEQWKELQNLPRVATTIEAEAKISEWIAGEGLETVKYRFNIAKQKFDPDNAPAIAAHYCSVYTKNPANKDRLLKDPVTHFSDGLFSYLKNEESFGRDRQPGNQGPTRNGKANLNHLGKDAAQYAGPQKF